MSYQFLKRKTVLLEEKFMQLQKNVTLLLTSIGEEFYFRGVLKYEREWKSKDVNFVYYY